MRFAERENVEQNAEVKDLGCMVNIKGDLSKEIAHRIVDSMLTVSRVHLIFLTRRPLTQKQNVSLQCSYKNQRNLWIGINRTK